MPTGKYIRTKKHREIIGNSSTERFQDPIKKQNHIDTMNRTEVKNKIRKTLKQTREKHPEIVINATKKRKETFKNNPEIRLNIVKSFKQTIKNNPEITIKRIKKLKKYRTGKHLSDITKQKIRIKMINHIKNTKGNIHPNVGKNEIQLLDEFELSNNIKLIRQYEILGYFVDGYCEDLNLVVEIDERVKIKERDIRREKEIIKELNCDFIRVKDNFKTE